MSGQRAVSSIAAGVFWGGLAAVAVLLLFATSAAADTRVPAGTYTSSQTWTLAGSPWIVDGNVTFQSGATLTVEPGVTVRVAPHARIQVGETFCCSAARGLLYAQGTVASPIVFEATNASTGWAGIWVRNYYASDSIAVLRNVTLRHASTYAVDLASTSSPVFDNVTFNSPGAAGLYLQSSSPAVVSSTFVGGPRGIQVSSHASAPTVRLSAFQDQTLRHARVGLGTQFVDSTFSGTGSAVELAGGATQHSFSFTVHPLPIAYELPESTGVVGGATMTIRPGVHLRVMPGVNLDIGATYCCSAARGHLSIEGTTAAPVLIDGAPGWTGIRFRNYYPSDTSGTLRNVTFANATTYALDLASTSSVTLDNATIVSPGVAGMYLSSSSPTVQSSTFRGGPRGIVSASYTSLPTVRDTLFVDQTQRHARVGIGSVLERLSFAGTGTAVELLGGAVHQTSSITVGPIAAPLELVEWVGVASSATLTLRPGVHLVFVQNNSIEVGYTSCCSSSTGHLSIAGTVEEPVRLDAPLIRVRNYYGGSSTTTLRNVTLHGSPSYALDLVSPGSVVVDNATFSAPRIAGLFLNPASPLVTSSRFVGGERGILATSYASVPTLRDVEFDNQTARHARVGIGSTLGTLRADGTGTAIELLGGNVHHSSGLTVRRVDIPQELVEWVGVANSATLTFEPGAQLKGVGGASIEIGYASCCSSSTGHLRILGTPELPVLLEAPLIRVRNYYGGSSTIEARNATLRGSPGHAIDLATPGAVTLDNLTIQDPADSGVFLQPGSPTIVQTTFVGGRYGVNATSYASAPTVRDSTFRDQTVRHARVGVTSTLQRLGFEGTGQAVEVMGGGVWYTSSFTLRALDVPYDVADTFGVTSGATLTIEAGVRARFAPGAYIEIGNANCCSSSWGVLLAEGTTDRPIVIESRSGAASGGGAGLRFRNYNGESTRGTMRNVTLRDVNGSAVDVAGTSQVTLDNLTVERTTGAGFSFTSASPTLRNCVVRSVGSSGVLLNSASPTIVDCRFEAGQRGVDATSLSSAPTIRSSRFAEQSIAAVRVAITADLRGNVFEGTDPKIELWGGAQHWTTGVTLRDQNATYVLLQWAGFRNQQTFTIEPGVSVLATNGTYFQIGSASGYCCSGDNAHFQVSGTTAEPVVLAAAPGHTWSGVLFRTWSGQTATGVLRNVTVRGVAGSAFDSSSNSGITFDNVTIESPTAHGFALSSSSPTIVNCTVRNPGGAGVWLSSSSPTIRGCTFIGGQRGVDATSAASVPSVTASRFDGQSVRHARVAFGSALNGNTYVGTGSAVELWGGRQHWTSAVTLTADAPRYELHEWAGIRNQQTLRISAGVHLQAANGSYLQIGSPSGYCCSGDNGNLDVAGTAQTPVLLEAKPGDTWGGIQFRTYYGQSASGTMRNATIRGVAGHAIDSSSNSAITVDNVTIERPTGHGIALTSASITVKGCTIDTPGGAGIWLSASSPTITGCAFLGGQRGVDATSASSAPTITDSRFVDQTVRYARVGFPSSLARNTYNGTGTAIELWGGNQHWTTPITLTADVAYELNEWAGIRNQQTLRLAPGVRIQVATGAYLQIGSPSGYCCSGDNGNLDVAGTAQAPVLIEAKPGQTWGGIQFRTYYGQSASGTVRNLTLRGVAGHGIDSSSNSAITLDNVTIERPTGHGIALTSASITIKGCTIDSPGGAGIWLSSSSPSVARCTFLRGQRGVDATSASSAPTLTDSRFVDQSVRFARVGFASSFARNTYEGTGTAVELWGGNQQWTTPITLRKEAGLWEVSQWAGIRNQQTLTIEAGVHVRFASDAYLTVGSGSGYCCSGDNGHLEVRGTAAEPVLLESLSGNNTPGWGGLRFPTYYGASASGTIRNLTIVNAQNAIDVSSGNSNIVFDNLTVTTPSGHGAVLSSASPTFLRCTFDRPGLAGIYLSSSSPVVNGCTFTGGQRGIEASSSQSRPTVTASRFADQTARHMRVGVASPLSGNVYEGSGSAVELLGGNTEWPNAITLLPEVPYEVREWFGIRGQQTLSLRPGVVLRFADGAYLNVGSGSGYCCNGDAGHLDAQGTTAAPVVLESVSGNNTPGWGGVRFRTYYGDSATGTMRNVTIRNVGGNAIDIGSNPRVTMERLLVENVTGTGLYSPTTTSVTSSTFRNTTTGMSFAGGAPTVRENIVSRASSTGIRLANVAPSVIRNNVSDSGTAIDAYNVDNARFERNRLTGNLIGLRLDAASTGNVIFDNLFRNLQNANDTSALNTWSVAPTAGTNVCGGPNRAGNCWSDYLGIDETGDGIGDTLVPHRANITGTGDQRPLSFRLNADFVFETLNATLGLIQFRDASTSPVFTPVSWSWDFADGTTAATRDPIKDYDVEGLFNVTLTVVDDGGRTANVTRTVLLDTLPPQTTGLLSGLQGDDGWWVSNVTLDFEADDASSVDSILYRVGGNGSFVEFSAPINITREGRTLVEYFSVDIAGNRELTRFLNVSVDRTRPLTNVTLAGELHGSGWFRSNVTVSLAGADNVSGLRLVHYRVDGGNIAIYNAPFTVSGTGAHSVEPFAKDVAGNLEAIVPRAVRIDLDAPVTRLEIVAGQEGNAGWYRSAVTARFNASDLGAGVALVEVGVDGEAPQPQEGDLTLEDGVHALAFRATDLVDRVEPLQASTLRVDATLPGLDVALRGSRHATGWYVSTPWLFANATDATSGVDRVEYRQNSNAYSRYTAPRSFVGDGNHTLTARAFDLAGNLLTLAPLPMPIDLNPPFTGSSVSGTHGSGIWYRSGVSVSLSPGDGAGSGVIGTSYSVDGGAQLPYAAPIPLTAEGVHRVNYSSTDVVGWVESLRSRDVGIDLTRPTVAASIVGVRDANGTYTGPVNVTITGSDSLSGIQLVQYNVNGAGWTSVSAASKLLTYNSSGTIGITFRAQDLAGNVADLGFLNFTIELDLAPPVTNAFLTGSPGSASWYRGPVTVRLQSVDAASGVGLVQYRVDGAEWIPYNGTFTIDGDAVHLLEFFATDLVGNVEGVRAQSVRIDATPPAAAQSLAGTAGRGDWFTSNVSVALSQSDATSGASHIRYRVDNGSVRTYGGPFALTTSGVHVVNYTAFDVAGNPSTREFTIAMDLDAPTVNLSAAGIEGNRSWFRSMVNLTLNASDPTSGIFALKYRIGLNGTWLDYVGPITLDVEGEHHIEYYAVDGSGRPGIVYSHDILIDLTTPIVGVRLENTLYVEIRGRIYIEGSLCIEVTGLDLLSGVQDAYLRLTGAVHSFVQLRLGVELHCFEVGGDGPITIGGGACDAAGNCDEDLAEVFADTGGPSVDIMRPFPGALNLQNVSLPIFRTAFANPDGAVTLDAGGIEDVVPVEDQEIDTRNATLASTTVVAGTRVPVWVKAEDDGNPIDRVELFLDGVSLGILETPQNVTWSLIAWDREEGSYDPPEIVQENFTTEAYVFTLDTFALRAGEHQLVAKAWDLPGRAATILRPFVLTSPATADHAATQAEAQAPLPAETPPELRENVTEASRIAHVFLRLHDTLVLDNYLYLDETVVRHYGLDRPPADHPPLVYTDIGGRPTREDDEE